jgi:hypothetical protein
VPPPVRPSRLAILAAAAALGCVSWAQLPGGGATIDAAATRGPAPWTGLEPLREEGGFRFAVVSDRTGEHRDGVFEAAMPKINLVRPEFVVSVGDLIEGYSDDPTVLAREWDEIEAFVAALDMPFFYAAGNHDMSNAVMARVWRERFGPSYYHFRYRDVLFVVLNSELFGMVHDPRSPLPGPWTQADQMVFLERVLAGNDDARWTFVFVHQPLWDAAEIHPDWLHVEELLGSRPYTVFAGHYHRYTKHVRHDRSFITLGTTGGGTRLRGTVWGEFDHVAFVTMTADGPVVANLLLDGIEDADVSTAGRRALVDRLARAVATEPLIGEGPAFEEGVARFSIANEGAHPLEVVGRFERSAHLEPARRDVRRTVAPGGVVDVAVAVRGRSIHPYESIAPGVVRWRLATRDDTGRPVAIETNAVILPERRFVVPRAASTIAVDGDLSDWGALPFAIDEPAELSGHGVHRGPDDCSFRFGVRHDGERLLLAVAVRDDSLVASSERVARHQDNVSVNVDARPDPERSANQGFFAAIRSGALAKMVSALVTVAEPRPDPILALFAGATPGAVATAARRTGEGYAVEVAVPAALLDERRGASWDSVRVNVTVTDYDEGEPDHVALSWRPSRFGDRAISGAGTFVRH